MNEKPCTRCQLIKPVSAFSFNPTGVLKSWCRQCMSENTKRWHEEERRKRLEKKGGMTGPVRPINGLNLLLRAWQSVGNCEQVPPIWNMGMVCTPRWAQQAAP